MIAIAKEARRRKKCPPAWQHRFLEMLPQIREQARVAFHAEKPEANEDLIAEVVANAYVAFVRLVERGKVELAYPTPLAQFAIRQIRSGRRVGCKLNIRDVSSRHAQLAKALTVQQLDQFDAEEGEWREVLVEDKHAGPAETAAARIDVAAWFRSLARRQRKIAQTLAQGETTGKIARMFGLTAGRVSQLRAELRRSWGRFQGESAVA